MDDMAFIVSRMLESKIAIAENNDQNTLIVTLDVLKEILALLKEQEQKTGHWTTKRTLQHDGEWYCNQCEYEPTVFENTPFCPNCGAKMRGR